MDPQNLIWIDLEMTGLEPETDRIIEIATIVTDKELNILAEGPVMAIHQTDDLLDAMDEWNTEHHGKSGLTQRVKDSPFSVAQAEQLTLDFLGQWIEPGMSPMCGNTVSQDRRFLARYMSDLEAYFHYRHIDVSTIKELTKRWHPESLKGFSKKGAH